MLTIRNTHRQSPAAKPGIQEPAGAARSTLVEDPQRVQCTVLEQYRRETAELKGRLHAELASRLDLARLDPDSPEYVPTLRHELQELTAADSSLKDDHQRQRLITEVIEETLGLGPLEALLGDPAITDILINGPRQVFIERDGVLEPTSLCFRDDQHVIQIIDRIVAKVGRRVDAVSPMVDARLPDGSRVNAIVPPVAVDGPMMSIRRFGAHPIRMTDMLRLASIAPEMTNFLSAAVQARLNILIVGGTGSGKTTLLNCLSSFVPARERVITIEDAAELQLQQAHVVRLETRPADTDGRSEITPRQLLKNALRMRPDRIIMGEVRGAEALDMLQAMNTGHEGSMTTLHANSTRDALSRIETMVSMAGFDLSVRAIRQHFAAAIHLIVQLRRTPGGRRRVVRVSEVTGMEGDTVSMQDLFIFQQTSPDGGGHFESTGLRSMYSEHIAQAGIELPPVLFERRVLTAN